MVMSEDSDWSQCPAVTNSLQREAKERWRGIWVWKCIEWACEREGREWKWSTEINTCLYDHWAAGVGHVDASRKLRSVRDHRDVHDTVTTPTCTTCMQMKVKVASRLTNVSMDTRAQSGNTAFPLCAHGHKWTEENLLTSTTAKCLAFHAKDILTQMKSVLIWSNLQTLSLAALKGRRKAEIQIAMSS